MARRIETMWQTDDGKFFASEEAALDHEVKDVLESAMSRCTEPTVFFAEKLVVNSYTVKALLSTLRSYGYVIRPITPTK